MSKSHATEAERALFEEAFDGKLDFFRMGDSGDADYFYSETGFAWDGWQAARAIPLAAADMSIQSAKIDTSGERVDAVDIPQAAAEPVEKWKVCGTCMGRERRDVAHGVTEPCKACNGKGAVRAAPDRAPSIELSGDDAEQVRQIWESARADAAMYVEGHCADGSRHAAAIMDQPLPKITMRAPSTDSAPKFDEAEFDAMVKHGTEVWGKEPDNIAEILRAGGDSATFDRRWSLARDGFGLQRNDESGEYVAHDDAVAVIHRAIAAMKGEA